jgi:hypothetical protein
MLFDAQTTQDSTQDSPYDFATAFVELLLGIFFGDDE